MKILSGRRALVTGAAGGIGAAIARSYAEAGANLALCDVHAERLTQTAELCCTYGVKVALCESDASTATGAKEAVEACVKAYGGIDIVVNNAGMLTQAPCIDLSHAMWEEMLRVDLTSVFLVSQQALPYMIKQCWGRIINIASQLGIKGGVELTHYAAAKAGVIGFTKSLALEVAKNNVLVNAIAPGPIETPLLDGLSQDWKETKAKELPLGRFGQPHEIAPTAVLLASDPGGNLYVGQTLGPNSGDVMP